MAIKKDILDALWAKTDFWAKKTTEATAKLVLAQSAHREACENLAEAEKTVAWYKSTHEKLIAAIITIEDFINDD
jgi:hypothetical protein